LRYLVLAIEEPIQSNTLLLLIAPIAGLLGTALGWYLNRWTELRRRQWQLEDDKRTWLRTREHDRELWTREQRKEGYVAFINTANRAMQETVDSLALRNRGEEWVADQRDRLKDLLYDLLREEARVTVFGNSETSNLAIGVRSAIHGAMDLVSLRHADDPIEEREQAAALILCRSSMDAFMAKVREDLGVIEKSSGRDQ
jgi:hypothetical protein